MATISATRLRDHLGDYLDRAKNYHDRITITRNGKPAAVLVPMQDAELLRQIEDRIDLATASEARAEAERDGWVTWAAVKTQE